MHLFSCSATTWLMSGKLRLDFRFYNCIYNKCISRCINYFSKELMAHFQNIFCKLPYAESYSNISNGKGPRIKTFYGKNEWLIFFTILLALEKGSYCISLLCQFSAQARGRIEWLFMFINKDILKKMKKVDCGQDTFYKVIYGFSKKKRLN